MFAYKYVLLVLPAKRIALGWNERRQISFPCSHMFYIIKM